MVVSDPTHLFRVSALCERAGLDVYTSPRQPLGNIDSLDMAQRYAHEIVSYTTLVLGLSDASVYVQGKLDD